jgi:hypothetical protein
LNMSPSVRSAASVIELTALRRDTTCEKHRIDLATKLRSDSIHRVLVEVKMERDNEAAPTAGPHGSEDQDSITVTLPKKYFYALPGLIVAMMMFAFLGAAFYSYQTIRLGPELREQIAIAHNFSDYLHDVLREQHEALSAMREQAEAVLQKKPDGTFAVTDAEAIRNSLSQLSRNLPEALSQNEDMIASVEQFARSTSAAPRFSLNLSPISVAEAKPKKWTPPSKASANPSAERERGGLLDKLGPLLWALLLLPLLIGAWAASCVYSSRADVRGFGMCLVTALFGYYTGLGASLFALAV